MNRASEYYISGFTKIPIFDGPQKTKLISLLLDLQKGQVKDGFEMRQKYSFSADMQPSVMKYDDVFIDFLVEQKLPEHISNLTGQDLTLVSMQVRQSFPGKSYMSWHRDTHFYRGKKVGNSPPIHKMIYYPRLESQSHKKLSVVPGSHRFMIGYKILDLLYARIAKRIGIFSDNDTALFFNTSILHHVEPEQDTKGSLRVIFSFAKLSDYDGNAETPEMAETFNKKSSK